MDSSVLLSPLGPLHIRCSAEALLEIAFADSADLQSTRPMGYHQTVHEQLTAYFEGKLKSFSLQCAPEGTSFQQRVWKVLMAIPYGKTISYAALAQQLGDPKCIRAAASANGKNKIPIIIPCHRVIGTDGSLTGYAGGLERKKLLLQLEGSAIIQPTLF